MPFLIFDAVSGKDTGGQPAKARRLVRRDRALPGVPKQREWQI